MKKRLLSTLLALAMIVGLLPGTAWAADSDFTIENGVLTKYNGSGGDVIIPDSVTSIGGDAFSGCTSLTSVSIPTSVTSIGGSAFYYCPSLTSVNIPTSVTSIGGKAFSYTPWLASQGDFAIVNGILIAYQGSGGDVTIPSGVTTIGQDAFNGCISLTSATIPSGVTSIGGRAFYCCNGLTSVTIPSSVTSIGHYAFDGCISLNSIIIQDGVTSIESYAFSNCRSLTNVTIPSGVTSIGDRAFLGCTSLTSVTIPSSVTSIGEFVFYRSSLTDIYYAGSESQWSSINIGTHNSLPTIHYSTSNPSTPEKPSTNPIAPDGIQDTIQTRNYKVISLHDSSNTEIDFSYAVPTSGVTMLIFFRAESCSNSVYTLKSIAQSSWVKNSNLRIVLVETTGASKEAVQSFVDENLGTNQIYFFDILYRPHPSNSPPANSPHYLQLQYTKLVYGSNSGTWPFVMLITEHQARNYIRFSGMGMCDAAYYGNALSTLLATVDYTDTVNVTVAGTQYYNYAADVVAAVNAQRSQNGQASLTWNRTLTEYAMQRAAEIALYYDHIRPNGESYNSIFDSQYGSYARVGENIAWGQTGATEVMNSWMNSEGHRANILSANYTQIGVGCFTSRNTTYWVQLFGDSRTNTAQINSGDVKQANVTVSTLASHLNTHLTTMDTSLTISSGETATVYFASTNSRSGKDTMLVPIVSDVKDNDNSSLTIATASVSADSQGTVTLYPQATGTGTVYFRAYEDDPISVTATLIINIRSNEGSGDEATITNLYPANGATEVGYGANSPKRFQITFDREIANDGSIAQVDLSKPGAFSVYRASDDQPVYQSTQYSTYNFLISYQQENILSISSTELDPGTECYITLDAGVVQFKDGTTNPAITKGQWTFTTTYFDTKETITFQTGDKDKPTANVDVSWNDGWFINNNTSMTYNHELACTAMALSGAAYVEDANGLPRSDSVQDALKKFGFEALDPHNYDDSYYDTLSATNNDHVAYTFALKKTQDSPNDTTYLIAIVVKGTSGNEEWYSNFNIGAGDTHAGFMAAAKEVMDSLNRYLKANHIDTADKNAVKFLVTGHSRGAAVANLVAAELTTGTVLNKSIKAYGSNVYGYTFATPTVSMQAKESGYKNVYNIISGEDFVTQVPLSKWGFKHYGIDLLLPSRSYFEPDKYNSLYFDMSKKYTEMVKKDFKPYQEGTQAVDTLKQSVYNLANTPSEFYNTQHWFTYDVTGAVIGRLPTATTSEYFGILADFLVKGPGINVGSLVNSLRGDFAPITSFFVENHIINPRVFSAHSMAGYYSWLSSCSAEELFGSCNKSTYATFKRTTTACPVDVYVYDENGVIVASVENEEIIVDSLVVHVEDGVKTIDLPNDQEYSIKIVATDEGSVSYTVEELSAGGTGSTVMRTVGFNDISIADGDELTGVVNDVMYTNKDNYTLTKNGTEIIYANYDNYNQSILFTDVDKNAYYYDAVLWAVEQGITNGTSATTFSPNQNCTEIQILTFLWRAAGKPVVNVALPVPVTGVDDYISAAKWAYSKGMIDATFHQNKSCTRASAVKFIWQAFGSPAASGSSFTDVSANANYAQAVAWAVANGITTGTSATTFTPDATCTRAQIVTFLHRAYALNGHPSNSSPSITVGEKEQTPSTVKSEYEEGGYLYKKTQYYNSDGSLNYYQLIQSTSDHRFLYKLSIYTNAGLKSQQIYSYSGGALSRCDCYDGKGNLSSYYTYSGNNYTEYDANGIELSSGSMQQSFWHWDY